ncbi:MAG: DUF5683 domain-containing protein [Fidelibacterota bacterium]
MRCRGPFLVLVGLTSLHLLLAQAPDSLSKKSPKKAALWALVFPGAGQLYNGKIAKAIFILGMESLAFSAWRRNAWNVRHYDENNDQDFPLSAHRYLEKRNKYAWWVGFIYIYGLLDAVVDAHLQSFDAVMSEELAPSNQAENQTKSDKP